MFEHESRTYWLYVPRGYHGTRDVPVVFDFHGSGSDGIQQMLYSDFMPEADRDTFLIVAPDGQDPTNRRYNLYHEPGLQDDVKMVAALLDHIEATLCVDRTRVYSTGMSNGGGMTSVLACVMYDRFAAFAAVAYMSHERHCDSTRPRAFMGIAGTADPNFTYGLPDPSGEDLGFPDSMAAWAAQNGCAKKFRDRRLSTEVRERTWSGCRSGSEIVFYIIDGGGHTWPGAIPLTYLGKTTTQLNATATIWKFFQAHALP